jgi:hypothetical protein
MVPSFMGYLEPLWSKSNWSDEHAALGKLVAEFLAIDELGLCVEFVRGDAEENREELRRVVRWFLRV